MEYRPELIQIKQDPNIPEVKKISTKNDLLNKDPNNHSEDKPQKKQLSEEDKKRRKNKEEKKGLLIDTIA